MSLKKFLEHCTLLSTSRYGRHHLILNTRDEQGPLTIIGVSDLVGKQGKDGNRFALIIRKHLIQPAPHRILMQLQSLSTDHQRQ